MKKQTLQEQCLTELLKLDEATRTQLVAQSRNIGAYKNQERGKNRFDRKRYSKIANAVKSYNQIDMNNFWKKDILQVNIPVVGENDEYAVTIKLEGVVAEMHKNIKNNNNKLEFRTIIQALTKVFNTTDVYTKCTCADYCLHPDTKIKLLDGTTITVNELEKKVKTASQPIYLYSVDENGDFKPGKIKDVWVSGQVDKLLKVTLDNGNSIITTPEHPYMLRNGQYLEAKDLKINTPLMPLYFGTTVNGYETIKANSKATTEFYSTYKQVANVLLQDEIEEAKAYYKLNHTVKSIEVIQLSSPIDVYDIEVEDYHNFYVDAGVILHNCYRFAHWNIIKNVSVDDSSKDPGPGKGIANPNDDKGRGCKHILLVLSNGDWMMKVASVINNYCHFLSEKKPDAFLKLVFPKLYGVPADEAEQNDLVADNEELESGKDLIDIINDWARTRGRYQKGSNKNPITGTGGRSRKPVAEKPAEEKVSKEKPEEKTEEAPNKKPEDETSDN